MTNLKMYTELTAVTLAAVAILPLTCSGHSLASSTHVWMNTPALGNTALGLLETQRVPQRQHRAGHPPSQVELPHSTRNSCT